MPSTTIRWKSLPVCLPQHRNPLAPWLQTPPPCSIYVVPGHTDVLWRTTASVSDEGSIASGGSACEGSGGTSFIGMGLSPMSTSPNTSRELLDAEKLSGIRLHWHFISCLQLRTSQPGHPTVYSGDPGLRRQCVAGRPLCVFGTKLSSCSSTRTFDLSVGSDGCVDVSRSKTPQLSLTLHF